MGPKSLDLALRDHWLLLGCSVDLVSPLSIHKKSLYQAPFRPLKEALREPFLRGSPKDYLKMRIQIWYIVSGIENKGYGMWYIVHGICSRRILYSVWFKVPRQGRFQKPWVVGSSCLCGLLGSYAFVLYKREVTKWGSLHKP